MGGPFGDLVFSRRCWLLPLVSGTDVEFFTRHGSALSRSCHQPLSAEYPEHHGLDCGTCATTLPVMSRYNQPPALETAHITVFCLCSLPSDRDKCAGAANCSWCLRHH